MVTQCRFKEKKVMYAVLQDARFFFLLINAPIALFCDWLCAYSGGWCPFKVGVRWHLRKIFFLCFYYNVRGTGCICNDAHTCHPLSYPERVFYEPSARGYRTQQGADFGAALLRTFGPFVSGTSLGPATTLITRINCLARMAELENQIKGVKKRWLQRKKENGFGW